MAHTLDHARQVVEALLLACGVPRKKMLRQNGDPLLASIAGFAVSAPCSGSLPDVEWFLEKYRCKNPDKSAPLHALD